MTTQRDESGTPAFASFRRDGARGALCGISLTPAQESDLLAVLAMDPAAVDPLAIDLSTLAFQTLPVGTLSPAQKAAYGKLSSPLLAGLCAVLEDVAAYAQKNNVPLELGPGQLHALLQKQAAYARLAHIGTTEGNRAIDQRALVSQFLVFLLDKVLERLEARLASASPAAHDQLLDRYAPALSVLDEVRREPATRRAELAAARGDLSEKVEEARKDQAAAETKLALSQDLFVSREALFDLARRHMERRREPASGLTPAPGTATPALPETMPRRIV